MTPDEKEREDRTGWLTWRQTCMLSLPPSLSVSLSLSLSLFLYHSPSFTLYLGIPLSLSLSVSPSPTVEEKKDQHGGERERPTDRGEGGGCQEKIGDGERTNKFLGGVGGGVVGGGGR